MIVEFSVKNFRSIKELQTLSFVCTGLKSPAEFDEVDNFNIAESDFSNTPILKTVGIYGANGSGKSNVIKALQHFIVAIRNEASSESNLSALCDPFLYQENNIDSESFFQIVLTIEKKKYRYGFTVKKNIIEAVNNIEKSSKELITNEWLFGTKEKNSREYFTRTETDVKKDQLPNKEKIPPLPYRHTLFLTHASAFESTGICATIRNFFKNWTISNFSDELTNFRYNSLLLIEKEQKKTEFLELLSSFNLKYDDVIIERDTSKPLEPVVSQDKIFFMKSYKNHENQSVDVKLNLRNNESAGTQKLFDLAGLLLRAFQVPASVFVIIDEIDSNFHPSLLITLIKLFNNPSINRNNSQLLFTSHDTNLMSPGIMRRDQFYFTEKDEYNATRLYSLADLKGIRNDANFAKQYLAGFYGALPLLETYSNQSLEEDGRAVEN